MRETPGPPSLPRRFARHRLALLGTVILALFAVLSLAAPWLAPYDPLKQSLRERLQPPTARHLLGTDEFGRDVLSRVLHGTRLSVGMGLATVLLGMGVGAVLGVAAGFFPRLDNPIMRVMDLLLAFPAVLLAVAIVAVLRPGLMQVVVALAVRSIPGYARIARSAVLTVRQLDYTEAARALGASPWHVVSRTVLPNCWTAVFVFASLQVGNAILLGSALSFLGLGVQPPSPEWGRMVSEGRAWLRDAPHVAAFPGVAIFLLVVSVNLVADAVRDTFDPRLRGV